MNVADTVRLVDTLERLGIDNPFVKEVEKAIDRVHDEELDFGSSNDLHVVALRFRLHRQHGFWVSADVFDKFRDDDTGSFNINLSNDLRGLLSLYNAAHMAVPGETILDDAIVFTRRHLEAAKGKLTSPIKEQVSHALDIPLPRFMRQLETMHYITEYEKEEPHDIMMLELAKINLNLLRSVHLKELKDLSLWWRDLYDSVKLTYCRDRIVESYFYSFGVFHGEEISAARIILTKVFGLLVLIDDTFDVRATFEESQMLDDALQRWDESMVSLLPEYLRMFYIKTLSNFNEIEDTLEPYEKYRMAYVKKEAKWFNENCTPSFKEHLDVSLMATGLPLLFFTALMSAGQVINNEAFEWALDMPDMFCANIEVGRFLNDIGSYKALYRQGKCEKDVASTVECYMREYGTTGEEAVAAIAGMVEHAWRRINKACMEVKPAVEPVVQCLLNTTRVLEAYYLHGRDGLTYGRDLKELITFLFLKDV
uniref:Terpene synthase n=1 Tax=Setaria italica TaxID=4555 RepID=K3ZLH1_SETIT